MMPNSRVCAAGAINPLSTRMDLASDVARAAPVVEGDDALRGPRQVGDKKPDARVQLSRMPFDLDHNVPGLVPALRLIAEAGVITSYLVRWSSDWSLQQISDLFLQDLVGRQPDCVAGTLGFEQLVDLGIGESRIAPEIQMLHDASIASDHRLQQRAPAIGTMHIARPQRTPLDIAELVEQEQRMIAGAGKMPVVAAALLLAVSRALARIHVEHDVLRRSPPAYFVDPLAGQISERGKVLGPTQPFRLKAAHLAGRSGRPADRPVPNHPAHRRVATQPLGIVHV